MHVLAASRTRVPHNLRAFLTTLGAGEAGFGGARFGAADDLAEHVHVLERESQGIDLPHGHVPMTTYWLLDDDGSVIGMSRLRHVLNDHLRFQGGHIGYYIAPSSRRRGHASTLLRATLAGAKKLGLAAVLLTTSNDNIASAAVIRRQGGIADGEGVDLASGRRFTRYWISIP